MAQPWLSKINQSMSHLHTVALNKLPDHINQFLDEFLKNRFIQSQQVADSNASKNGSTGPFHSELWLTGLSEMRSSRHDRSVSAPHQTECAQPVSSERPHGQHRHNPSYS
jgi:hypothetical protein